LKEKRGQTEDGVDEEEADVQKPIEDDEEDAEESWTGRNGKAEVEGKWNHPSRPHVIRQDQRLSSTRLSPNSQRAAWPPSYL
jgi:hypothetical protein